jgi:hypothetical protein
MVNNKLIKKLFFGVIAVVLASGLLLEQGVFKSGLSPSNHLSDNTLQTAFDNKQSNLQIHGHGTVLKVLPDDKKGSRHQKFILKINPDRTLLVAHNIDLAPRIYNLKKGDSIEFFGEYEWNSKGGIIHWTHHDPNNRHIGGWLKHEGKTYQ